MLLVVSHRSGLADTLRYNTMPLPLHYALRLNRIKYRQLTRN